MTVPGDTELVERVLSADMGAFRVLADRYKRKVYYISLGIVGNHNDAEDIMQESLMQALRSLPRLRQPGGFGAWILRIAYNKSIDLKRRKKREIKPDVKDEGITLFETIESNYASDNPERLLHASEIGKLVKATMETLPESQKTAFALKHIAQLSIREIAAATNSTEATVKTNVYRSIQRMRKALSHFKMRGSADPANNSEPAVTDRPSRTQSEKIKDERVYSPANADKKRLAME